MKKKWLDKLKNYESKREALLIELNTGWQKDDLATVKQIQKEIDQITEVIKLIDEMVRDLDMEVIL